MRSVTAPTSAVYFLTVSFVNHYWTGVLLIDTDISDIYSGHVCTCTTYWYERVWTKYYKAMTPGYSLEVLSLWILIVFSREVQQPV